MEGVPEYGWESGQMMANRSTVGKVGEMKKQKVAPKAASFKQATSTKPTAGTQDREKNDNRAQPGHISINLYHPSAISMEGAIP